MSKKIIFNIYRYQILPQDRIQLSFFDDIKNVDELIQRKNSIFSGILSKIESQVLEHRKKPIKFQLKYESDNFFIFKMGIKRYTKIGNEDLEDTKQDDWRYVFIIFWNKPDKQFLLIQDKSKVFSYPKDALKMIVKFIQKSLLDKNLIIKSESLFDKNDFWGIINEYPKKVSRVKFTLITPNMANISGELSQELKELFKSTNSIENTLEISAAKESILHLEQSNNIVQNVVDYASEGGGSAQIKIKGIRKTFSTTDKIKTIEIDEINITNPNQETIDIMKNLLENQ